MLFASNVSEHVSCVSIVQEEVTAEVNILLALKKQYKDLTGEDFAPAQQAKKPDGVAGKAKQAEPAKKAEQKKKQDQEKKAGKLDSSCKEEKEQKNEKGKADTDTSKQPSAQDSHVDKDSGGAREMKKVTRYCIIPVSRQSYR